MQSGRRLGRRPYEHIRSRVFRFWSSSCYCRYKKRHRFCGPQTNQWFDQTGLPKPKLINFQIAYIENFVGWLCEQITRQIQKMDIYLRYGNEPPFIPGEKYE